MTTCGTPCTREAKSPAVLAYQVWECTRSASPRAAAISTSTPRACSAPFALCEPGGDARARSRRPAVRRSSGRRCPGPAGQRPQRRDEVLDVDPRAAVDVRRPLPRHDPDAHGVTLGGGSRAGRAREAQPTGYVACTCAAAPRVLGIVLAGGEGKRLAPLTDDRAKPAVPFGGNYRLIDFVLSNLVNAEIRQIAVLTQYKSHSLDRHITQTWRMSRCSATTSPRCRPSSGSGRAGTPAAPTRSSRA